MILSTALLVHSGGFAVVMAARVLEGVSIGFLLLGYQVRPSAVGKGKDGKRLRYQIYAVEIAAKEDRGFVSSFTLMTGNFFGLLAAGIICQSPVRTVLLLAGEVRS